MAYKQTVAIIGATTAIGKSIAQRMSDAYCLLLMDDASLALSSWADELQRFHADAIIHKVDCCKEASWEADVIVLAVADSQLVSVVEKIKEVSTRKVVVQFMGDSRLNIDVRALLPFAKVIGVRDDEIFGHKIDIKFLLEKRQSAGDDVLRRLTVERGTVSA